MYSKKMMMIIRNFSSTALATKMMMIDVLFGCGAVADSIDDHVCGGVVPSGTTSTTTTNIDSNNVDNENDAFT
jgi:hypothetical protein